MAHDVTVLVDTSAVVAMLDRRDPRRGEAIGAFDELLETEILVTHHHVSVETISVLQRRGGLEAVREYVLTVEPTLDVHWVDEDLHRAALAAMFQADRRAVSLVDHTSFEFMRRVGIRTAFTLDGHFRDEGFDVVP
ncbi:MAG TPA: PIN domain-containing protein [Acidimicrobiia bacterium]|nr:PIN domain-containing protein [Acidimicrobiia bacterium]